MNAIEPHCLYPVLKYSIYDDIAYVKSKQKKTKRFGKDIAAKQERSHPGSPTPGKEAGDLTQRRSHDTMLP